MKVWIPCVISRSPFSGERIVEVSMEAFSYHGAVPTGYCRLEDGRELNVDPAICESVRGKVRAVLTNDSESGQYLLVMPDGEIIGISQSIVDMLEK